MKLWEKVVLKVGDKEVEGKLTMDEMDHKVYKFEYKATEEGKIQPVIIADGKEVHKVQKITLKKDDTFIYERKVHVKIWGL